MCCSEKDLSIPRNFSLVYVLKNLEMCRAQGGDAVERKTSRSASAGLYW